MSWVLYLTWDILLKKKTKKKHKLKTLWHYWKPFQRYVTEGELTVKGEKWN